MAREKVPRFDAAPVRRYASRRKPGPPPGPGTPPGDPGTVILGPGPPAAGDRDKTADGCARRSTLAQSRS